LKNPKKIEKLLVKSKKIVLQLPTFAKHPEIGVRKLNPNVHLLFIFITIQLLYTNEANKWQMNIR